MKNGFFSGNFAALSLSIASLIVLGTSGIAQEISRPESGLFIRQKANPTASALTTQPLTLKHRTSSKKGMFLSPRKDLNFKTKIWTFLIETHPQLSFYSDKIKLNLIRKWSRHKTDHYRFSVSYDGILLDASSVTAHFRNKKLHAVSTSIPAFEKIVKFNQITLDLHGAQEADGKEAKYAAIDGQLRAVLHYVHRDDRGLLEEVWEDAETGDIIERKTAGFDLKQARVQLENEVESETDFVDLIGLKSGVLLDGQHFSIDTEHEIGRVKSVNGVFDYQPYDRARFDQVATYQNLSESLQWFQDVFSYKPDAVVIPVIIDSELEGNPNNARYVPKGELSDSPLLIFGAGTEGDFENLARDKDVAMHELSHHIIYRYIDDARGQAASLHEGFADYFSYAKSEDPYLAEQVVVGTPFLRTAKIDSDKTYDNPYLQRNQHTLGQIWSAFLWETRETVGEEFDQVVFQALQYLNAGSNFGDGIEALLLADADLNSEGLSLEDESPNQCPILSSAVDRGYAAYLSRFESGTCGIDFAAIAAESATEKKKYDDGPLLFQSCGQIKSPNSLFSLYILMFLLALPLLIAFGNRRPE